MFWFSKKHPNALYMDIRREEKGFMKVRPGFEVAPDEIADYTNLPYLDKSFRMVVWDPPHTIRNRTGKRGVIEMRHGRLSPENWGSNLEHGFKAPRHHHSVSDRPARLWFSSAYHRRVR
jgi:hypothetical protein